MILEQLYVIKKSVEELRNKHHQYNRDKWTANASFKEEIDYLREENKNKTEIMKIMLRQISSETINPEIKEQTTDTNKIQKKTATLRKVPNNNRRFIPENPPPINSKSDNQRTSPRLDKSTDEKNDETLFYPRT